MATLREYFDTDFRHALNVAKPLILKSDNFPPTEIQARLHLDFDSHAKFISCYIPRDPSPLSAIAAVLKELEVIFNFMKQIEVKGGFLEERMVDSSDLAFTGRIYFYCESDIAVESLALLQKEAHTNGLSVCIRGSIFAMERSKLEKPLAFISHDTRDKETLARPIAIGLSKLMCPVWYDEFSLKVGDRLRESIERGLKECKKCVLILTPHFFSNTGWTKAEFNAIFARELIEGSDFILPVWAGVKKREVFDYCPSLTDRVAVDWNLGAEEVVRRLCRALH